MIAHLKHPAIHIRAFKVALVVGTLLCLINHGDNIFNGAMKSSDWIKLLMTYFVPYGVSLYSAIMALKKTNNPQA
ncbi:MAG: nitrate/nitrite transporter NrtS [Cellvibrionaceae bacterium]